MLAQAINWFFKISLVQQQQYINRFKTSDELWSRFYIGNGGYLRISDEANLQEIEKEFSDAGIDYNVYRPCYGSATVVFQNTISGNALAAFIVATIEDEYPILNDFLHSELEYESQQEFIETLNLNDEDQEKFWNKASEKGVWYEEAGSGMCVSESDFEVIGFRYLLDG